MKERGLGEDVVRMANLIARQFAYLPAEDAAAKVAYHFHAFWEPRMLVELERHVDRHPEDVEPAASQAVRSLVADAS